MNTYNPMICKKPLNDYVEGYPIALKRMWDAMDEKLKNSHIRGQHDPFILLLCAFIGVDGESGLSLWNSRKMPRYEQWVKEWSKKYLSVFNRPQAVRVQGNRYKPAPVNQRNPAKQPYAPTSSRRHRRQNLTLRKVFAALVVLLGLASISVVLVDGILNISDVISADTTQNSGVTGPSSTPGIDTMYKPEVNLQDTVDYSELARQKASAEFDGVVKNVNQWVSEMNAAVMEMEAAGADGLDVNPLLIGDGGVGLVEAYAQLRAWYNTGFTSVDSGGIPGGWNERLEKATSEGLISQAEKQTLSLAGQLLMESAEHYYQFILSLRNDTDGPDFARAREHLLAQVNAIDRLNPIELPGEVRNAEKLQVDLVDRLSLAYQTDTISVTATPMPGGMLAGIAKELSDITQQPTSASTAQTLPTPIPPTPTVIVVTPTFEPTSTTIPFPTICQPDGYYVGNEDAWLLVHSLNDVVYATHKSCANGWARIEWHTASGAYYWGLSQTWPTGFLAGTYWVPTKYGESPETYGAKAYIIPTAQVVHITPFVPQETAATSRILPTSAPPTIHVVVVQPTNVPPSPASTQNPDTCLDPSTQITHIRPWDELHSPRLQVNYAWHNLCNGNYYIAWMTTGGKIGWAWTGYIPQYLYTSGGYKPLKIGERWKPDYICSSVDNRSECWVAVPYN